MRIEGKSAVVTGASQGIGLALTKALLARGAARVVASDIVPIADQTLLAQEQKRLCWQRCDVTSQADREALAETVGETQLIFSNAGINKLRGLFVDDGLTAATGEIEVNYLGALGIIRALVPRLQNSGNNCAIVMTGSVLAEAPIPSLATYCISKAALGAMADILRAELMQDGIQVLLAKPGAVDTNLIAPLDIPKITAADAADEILSALEAGASEVLVGPEAKVRATAIATDRAAYFRSLGKREISTVTTARGHDSAHA